MQDKTVKLQTYNLYYFLDKKFFGDDGSQNVFVFQPILHILEKRKGKSTERGYILLNLSHYILLSYIA